MPTLTIDLELSEAEYRFASALPVAVRRRVASIGAGAAFATARDVSPEGEDESWRTAPSTSAHVEALAVALAQLDAGEVRNGDDLFERLYRDKGLALKP